MKFDLKSKILSVVLVTVFMIFLMLYCLGWVITRGPSKEAKRQFVASMSDSTITKIIPKLYLDSEEIERILTESETEEDLKTGSPLADLPESNTTNDDSSVSQGGKPEFEYEGIEIIDIDRNTYNAKLMIISDPKRVYIGTPEGGFGLGKTGETVYNMMKSAGAVAGINSGGLTSRTGGIPEGAVIKNGEVLWGNNTSSYYIAGFDEYGILHVGKMTIQEALDKGVTNATSHGPALIINGVPQLIAESDPSIRTAVGQRADGAVLLLAVTAKNETAQGATYEDLIELFTEYDAVNATNLYCGASATMVLGEENISGDSFATDYPVAAAILVK